MCGKRQIYEMADFVNCLLTVTEAYSHRAGQGGVYRMQASQVPTKEKKFFGVMRICSYCLNQILINQKLIIQRLSKVKS